MIKLIVFLVILEVYTIDGFQWQRFVRNQQYRQSLGIDINWPNSHSKLLPGHWAVSGRSGSDVEKKPIITNIKYGEVRHRVRRAVEDPDRVPLSSLKVGQKLRGRIISVAE